MVGSQKVVTTGVGGLKCGEQPLRVGKKACSGRGRNVLELYRPRHPVASPEQQPDTFVRCRLEGVSAQRLQDRLGQIERAGHGL